MTFLENVFDHRKEVKPTFWKDFPSGGLPIDGTLSRLFSADFRSIFLKGFLLQSDNSIFNQPERQIQNFRHILTLDKFCLTLKIHLKKIFPLKWNINVSKTMKTNDSKQQINRYRTGWSAWKFTFQFWLKRMRNACQTFQSNACEKMEMPKI